MLKLKQAASKSRNPALATTQVSVEDLEFEAIYNELKTANAALEAFSRIGKLTNEVVNVSIEAAAVIEVLEQAVGGGSSSISESICEVGDGKYSVSTEATEGMISKAAEKVKNALAKLWAWIQKQWSNLSGKNKENIEKANDLKERVDALDTASFKLIAEETQSVAHIERSDNGDYRTSFPVTMLFDHKVLKGLASLVQSIIGATVPANFTTAQGFMDTIEQHYRAVLKGLTNLFGTNNNCDCYIDGVPGRSIYLLDFAKSGVEKRGDDDAEAISWNDNKSAKVTIEAREIQHGHVREIDISSGMVRDHLKVLSSNLEVLNKLNYVVENTNDHNFIEECYEVARKNDTIKDNVGRLVTSNLTVENLIYGRILKDFIAGIHVHLNTLDKIIKDHESNTND